ncbi:MAG: helix-turn-helix transcriptional regulator [Alphaproteobacteria bacterium]
MDLNESKTKREAIKRFMKWYDINVSDWCGRAGMSSNTLYSFLNGHSNDINYGTLEKLAKALGVTVGVIMGEIGFQESAKPEFEQAPVKPKNKNDREALEMFMAIEDRRDKAKVLGYMAGIIEKKKPKK